MVSTIAESLQFLTEKLNETIKSFDAFSLELESAPIDELLDVIKETFEEKLRDPIERLVGKLNRDEYLSSEEIQLIEKWVIGDAEFYTKMENNLIDWISECKRLCSSCDITSKLSIESFLLSKSLWCNANLLESIS